MASQYPPKKNAQFILYFSLYTNTGAVIANPGTYTKKVCIDGGTVNDIAASVTEINTTYGLLSLVLSNTEMNGDAILIQIKDDTAGCVPLTLTLYTTDRLLNDLAFPATSGRGMVVDAAGLVDANTVKVGPTGAGTAQTAKDIGAAVPAAAPGASGGLFIAGTNAPVTITGSGNALTLTSTGANGHGLSATGNGSGNGILGTGGATGDGIEGAGGTSGIGIHALGGGNVGLQVDVGSGNHPAILATGSGTGAGLSLVSGTGNANGMESTGSGTGDGLHLVGGNGGGGDGLHAQGGTGAQSRGIHAQGGSTSGSGIRAESAGGNSPGVIMVGNGSGAGFESDGGATGDGIKAVGNAPGVDINADITGDITGNLSGSVNSVTTDVGITQTGADKVWVTATRTLTSFGTLTTDTATAVWNTLTSALTTAGSIGKLIVDNIVTGWRKL